MIEDTCVSVPDVCVHGPSNADAGNMSMVYLLGLQLMIIFIIG